MRKKGGRRGRYGGKGGRKEKEKENEDTTVRNNLDRAAL
jgi:hypothetical protein